MMAAFPAKSSGQVMTLKDCMEYATSNSTKLRIQQATNDDNQVARRDAILAAFTPKAIPISPRLLSTTHIPFRQA